MCEEDSARITIGEGNEYYRGDEDIVGESYIADSLAVGRVELCHDGIWRTVCRETWSRQDAAVACSQLGFSRAGNEYILSLFSFHSYLCKCSYFQSF